MSSVEEPPSKITKYEELQYLETEGEECLEEALEEGLEEGLEETLEEGLEEALEEGQEEWLSEGVLTDEDYTIEQDKTNPNITSQETQETKDSSRETTVKTDNLKQEHIEEQLNSLEGVKNEFPDELDTFLIRKTDGKVVEPKLKEENAVSKSQEENDGNDTDDLLRMLGEGDQKAKKKTMKHVKTEKIEEQMSSDDDDDDQFFYDRTNVKTLKVAKNAIIKKAPMKAEPEDMSEGDDESEQSSDEGTTVQRMFEMKQSPGIKSEVPKKIIRKHVVQVNTNYNKNEKPDSKPKQVQTLQHHQTTKSVSNPKSTLQKSQLTKIKAEVKTPTPFKPLEKTSLEKVNLKSDKLKSSIKETSFKGDDFDEIFGEEEFLEGEDIDLDEEEFGDDSDGDDSKKQRIMRPERMDEEVPSDMDSNSEGGSLYDELPSSDSEDIDDWFTLDIRAERAGDYLPLLGSKARELLLAERRRVSARVATLRQSLSALTDSARRQADQLRSAAMALAEIDDTLKAA